MSASHEEGLNQRREKVFLPHTKSREREKGVKLRRHMRISRYARHHHVAVIFHLVRARERERSKSGSPERKETPPPLRSMLTREMRTHTHGGMQGKNDEETIPLCLSMQAAAADRCVRCFWQQQASVMHPPPSAHTRIRTPPADRNRPLMINLNWSASLACTWLCYGLY